MTDPARPGDVAPGPQLDAGDFGPWLTTMQAALRGEVATDVPCGGCTACCTSSQFVHVGPDEVTTLARIPAALRFPAPGLPRGHVVLGYDERGRCPMLVKDRCSIYDDRPRACRTYDCRVFAATGIEIPEATKKDIAARVARWRFSRPSGADRARMLAVQSAARFLHDHPEVAGTSSPTQVAVLAIRIHSVFVDDESPGIEAIRGLMNPG